MEHVLTQYLPESSTKPYKTHDILKYKYTGMTYHMKTAATFVVQCLDSANKI